MKEIKKLCFIFLGFLILVTSYGCAAALLATTEAAVAVMDAKEKAKTAADVHKKPEKTQLQLRQIQTRVFSGEKNVIMKALVNVLQDEGFIIKSANSELGFLTGYEEIDISKKEDVFWSALAGEPWTKSCVVEVTVNISKFGRKYKVRANFQEKILNNEGGIKRITQIDDQKFYQDFFSKVDKAIFLQREGI